MCLLIVAHQSDPRYPLVIAANRDEFHARATATAGFWPEQPDLMAGRDLEQGGTWMGITRQGRFAAVTNYRDPSRTAPAPRSRGELPLNYLSGTLDPASYLHQVARGAAQYAGFNLLVGSPDSLWYLSNSRRPNDSHPRRLEPGIYGLSNARLDTPWPKVVQGRERLRELLRQPTLDHDALAGTVSDRRHADSETLASIDMHSEMEQLLSAQFIITERYGTRSTTTLWIDRHGGVNWRELSFDPSGELTTVQEATFDLVPPQPA